MIQRRRTIAILGLMSILLFGCFVETSRAQDGAAGGDESIPPALKGYKGREIAVTMHYEGAPWLTRESREREEDCTTLLKALHVQKGQTVCDLGCGNGFYTLKLAELVGEQGKVLAVDIQPEMLTLLKERAKDAGDANIRPILGSLIDPKLPKGGVDLILLVDVYHEFSHPEHMLRAMREALKPDGRMVLVEFRLEDPKVPIKLLHKMTKKQIMKEIPPNGFKLVEQFDELPWQHVMFFARDDAPLQEVKTTDSNKAEKQARKRIGNVLGETIYEDQLKGQTEEDLQGELGTLFFAPLSKKYAEDHKAEVTPTEAQIKAATKYFDERHAKVTKENNPDLPKRLEEARAKLAEPNLAAEEKEKLKREVQVMEAQAKPPGENFARFWLPGHLLQLSYYNNYGGGRLLWQQFGVEAFDAMHTWLKKEEELGNLKFDDPKHRKLAFQYWNRSHGAFLWDPKDRPEQTEEFLNPPWLKADGKAATDANGDK
jgi:ubiquinone/menaquinone biosynthesis C-methylase UbiE